MARDRRDAGTPESQALEYLDIRTRSTPQRAQGKPARLVNGSEIVNKSQHLDSRDRLPAAGGCRIAFPRNPIFCSWQSCSDLWPSLTNESINSVAIGLVMVICD